MSLTFSRKSTEASHLNVALMVNLIIGGGGGEASMHRFQCYVHGRHLRSSFDVPSFDMVFKQLKDHLTVKQAIFWVISGRKDKNMIITDLIWLKKIVNIACFQICLF